MKGLLLFKERFYKSEESGKRIQGLLAVCLFLFMMVACVSPHSGGNQSGLQVTMKLKQVSEERKLSVLLKGSDRSWDADTLAILSWWDGQG